MLTEVLRGFESPPVPENSWSREGTGGFVVNVQREERLVEEALAFHV